MNVDLYMNRFLDGQPYLCRMVDLSRTGARLVPMIEPDQSRAPRYMGLQFQLPESNEILTASGETVSARGERSACASPTCRRTPSGQSNRT